MIHRNSGRRLAIAVSCSALALGLLGCGYTLAGKASNIPEDIREVYVEPLENATSRSQVEQILTQAITEELVTRRRFSIVNSAAEADAILGGTVLDFGVRPVTFDSDGLATNFEIVITADMAFKRVPSAAEDEGEAIWSNARYIFREDYVLEGDGASYFDRENIAIEETAIRFADTMVTDLLEGF